MTERDLVEAGCRVPVQGFATARLAGQAKVFDDCRSVFEDVGKASKINRRHDVGELAKLIDQPAGQYGLPWKRPLPFCRIKPETVLLAAIACGFAWEQFGPTPSQVCLNIDQGGLVDALRRRAGVLLPAAPAGQPVGSTGPAATPVAVALPSVEAQPMVG
jgi:hypothetical protein